MVISMKQLITLREKGIAKAAKKADRIAAEGLCSRCLKQRSSYF
jgi:translation elongation factor EF-Ts